MKAELVKKKGFTLVEILIVLAIISVVVLLSVSSYGIVRKKVKLDIAASKLQSIIVEARDKARAGYYDVEQQDGQSLCFGFRLEKDSFVSPLLTKHSRLKEKNNQCDAQNAQDISIGNPEEDIIIKDIELFGEKTDDSVDFFFAPPDGELELKQIPFTDEDPILRVVLGFAQSDEIVDQREVILNVLTGSSYVQRFQEEN